MVLTPLSLEGAVDTAAFNSFVSQVLASQLRPSNVVLLNNLPVHLSRQVAATAAAVEAEVMWLPAYSPDFSPL